MNSGVTRRIDELGRIVIPKEIRKNLKIHNADELEIKVEDDRIILNKYDNVTLNSYISNIIKVINKVTNKNILLTSKDKVIEYCINNDNKLSDCNLSNTVTKIIENRSCVSNSKIILFKEMVDVNYIIDPININGDVIGSLILYSDNNLDEKDKTIINFSKLLLEKYYE